MDWVSELLLGFPLIIMIIQDFKTRSIIWWLILVFLVGALLIHYSYYNSFNINEILINLTFFIVQVGGLWVFFSLKEKELINITKAYIGIGDILFFIPLAFLFSSVNLIIYFVFSLMITLLIAVIYKYKIKSIFTIPLVGVLSITLLITRIINYLEIYNVYDNMKIIKILLSY